LERSKAVDFVGLFRFTIQVQNAGAILILKASMTPRLGTLTMSLTKKPKATKKPATKKKPARRSSVVPRKPDGTIDWRRYDEALVERGKLAPETKPL